jgi:hypothetical protein
MYLTFFIRSILLATVSVFDALFLASTGKYLVTGYADRLEWQLQPL